jgi:DNA-binding SARP family transcriptional activator/tetratricopeptide (TPR) repeat protein/DNA-binding XRE family transcriptional regulator
MIEMLEGMANAAPVGIMIQRYRQRAGLTQQEVADLSGVSVAGVRDLEQGRVTRPRVSTLRRLVEALGLSKMEFEGLLRLDVGTRASGVRVEVLGPLRVIVDGAVTDLGSEAQGVLLGLLALAPNQSVGRDGLVEAVWGSRPPGAVGDLLQSRVSRLRRRLRSARTDAAVSVTATHGGYQLDVTEDQLDLLAFRQKVAHARQLRGAGDAVSACVLFAEAMRLWRADPLAGLTVLQSHPVVTALVREWQAVVTEYAQAAAESGRYNEVLPLLRQAADTDPLHEGVHAGLMIVLAGTGQQAAALAVFDRLRRQLIEQLGADPGPELAAAYQRVLHRDVARQEFVPVSAHGQLPPDITEFSGRRAELRVMHDQLPDAAAGSTAVVISSLEGMGGVGKTRLAVHLAHQLLAGGRYADVQLYVDLRGHADQPPADPATVLASFLRLLGVPGGQIPQDLPSRSAMFRDQLFGKNALVLLDNAASEDQVLPLLPASSTNLVLITSRRSLALDGAHALPLDVFTAAEAEELLARVLGKERVAGDLPGLRRVVELCGRLPLAVTLVARRMQSRPGWTLTDLADRLVRTGDRLGELAAGTRQLRAVFDLSYQALDAQQQRVFRLLGLHPGQEFTAESVAALVDLPTDAARQVLDRLADEHLAIAVTGDRYRLHDLLHDYTVQIAGTEEPGPARAAAITRVLDYFLHIAATASRVVQPLRVPLDLVGTPPAHHPLLSTVEQAEAWQETERASLVAAVVFAADHGHPERCWQLAESLHGYLSRHGYVDDWLRTHQVALGAALAAGDRIGEAVTRTYLGSCYMFLDRSEDALDNLYRALELHRQAGNRNLETGALGFLGYECGRAGRFAEALEYTRQAISYASGRDAQREALLREHAGKLLTILGRFDEAFDNYERAIALYREEGLASDLQLLAEICVGDIYRNMGRLDEARELLERLVADAEEHGPVPNEAAARHRLGRTYWALGRLDDALDQLTEALGLARTAGGFTESEVLIDLGVVHRDAGRLEAALDMVGEAMTLAVTTKERYQQARALDALAGVHDRAGHPDLAEAHWRRAYDLFAELGTPEADRIRPRLRSDVTAGVNVR